MDARPTQDTEAFNRWWNSLTTRAKKAVIRKQERRRERSAAKTALRSTGASGYRCTCATSYATPDERRACRAAHPRAA